MPQRSALSQRASWAGGQPIGYLMHLALSHPELISLAAGFVDQETLPAQVTSQALDVLLSDSVKARTALQYGTTAGYGPLREQILDRHLQLDGISRAESKLTPDQIVITAGSNQLLHLLGDTLLNPGDIVLCAAPCYFVFLGILTGLGCRPVGVAVDEDGMVPESLEEQLSRIEAAGELDRVKAVYVTSYFDNPSSITLAADRRRRLVDIVKSWSKPHQIYLIEDAAYRELRYDGPDLASLRSFDSEGDTVVVAGSFSKSFAPGIRVGWGMLPKALVEPLKHQKGNIDFGSPNFTQQLMSTVIEMGLYEPHLQSLRQNYRLKMNAMLDAADEYMAPLDGVRWGRPSGGLYVWLEAPEDVDTGPTGPLLDRALEEGVLYVPGRYCYPGEGEPARNQMIRLSYGVQSPENIRRGIELLAKAIRQVSHAGASA